VAPRVRIVLLNYDGGETTIRCIQALHALDYPVNDLEIIMVDNASIDGLNWRVPRDYPRVKVIDNLVNEGFARGNNLAMWDLDKIDAVALINNDCIPDPSWLRELVDRMFRDEQIGATCSKMLFNKSVWGIEFTDITVPVCISNIRVDGLDSLPEIQFDERFDQTGLGADSSTPQHWMTKTSSFWVDDDQDESGSTTISVLLHSQSETQVTARSAGISEVLHVTTSPTWHSFVLKSRSRVINNAGGAIFAGFFGGDLGFKELDLGQRDTEQEVFAFCGGAVLLRKEFLQDVGLFDDTFFLYYEDFDLSWRGKRRGWRFVYTPKSVVLHEHAHSSGAGSPFFLFWVDRNRRLTLIKNAPFRAAAKATIGAFLWSARDCLNLIRQSQRARKPFPAEPLRYRLRQLGSFVKAIPAALRFRYRSAKSAKVPRRFVDDWLVSR
jgi:GT2 family glycosyltransferase